VHPRATHHVPHTTPRRTAPRHTNPPPHAPPPPPPQVLSHLPAGAALDFSTLLPANRSYAVYQGSTTTPPCTEGVLWHVLLNPQKLSLNQLRAFQLATGDNSCELHNGADRVDTSSNALQGGAGRRRGRSLQQLQRVQQQRGAVPVVWEGSGNGSVAGMHCEWRREARRCAG
jgi:hypothetical protein